MKKIILAVSVVLSSLILFSCGNTTWYTDFDTALDAAQKSKKEILFYFSGVEWDGKSADQKQNILDTETFISKAGKDFVLVNLDLIIEPTEEQQEEMEKISQIATKYNFQGAPSVLILSKEGYVIAEANIADDVTTPEAYLEFLATLKDPIKSYNDAIKAIKNAKELDKVQAIDTLYELTQPAYQSLLKDYIEEACKLDPENKSGLLAKFLMQRAYTRSIELITSGLPNEATNEFLILVKNPSITIQDKQGALYNAAYLSSLIGEPISLQIQYLQQAIDLDPESEDSQQFLLMIDELKKMEETASSGEK